MADETKTEVKLMEYPARLQMSMLGPVREIAASIPAGDKEVRVIGYVFGEARGVSYRNNQNSADGEPAIGLIGAFEGVPQYDDFPGMDPMATCSKRAGLMSGVAFLPPQLQAVIAHQITGGDAPPDEAKGLKRGQRSDKLGVTVPISVQIGIRKSESPVGYEWVTRALAKIEAVSPHQRMLLALGLPSGTDLRNMVTSGKIAQIETGNRQAALEAPAKPAEKAGKTSRKK
jgi:hypothetical protein